MKLNKLTLSKSAVEPRAGLVSGAVDIESHGHLFHEAFQSSGIGMLY